VGSNVSGDSAGGGEFREIISGRHPARKEKYTTIIGEISRVRGLRRICSLLHEGKKSF